MKQSTIIWIVVIAVLVGILVALYFFGKRMQKKQEESQKTIDAAAQQISMLIIDKKVMKLKEANLPAQVIEGTPWYLRRSKVPIIKAKVGPKIMTFMCDSAVYDIVPLKKEVKATVSGIYLTAVKGIRGPLAVPEKKKGFFARFRKK